MQRLSAVTEPARPASGKNLYARVTALLSTSKLVT
jgi:hypothetical protein